MLSRTTSAGYLAFAQGIASVSTILVASVLSRNLVEEDYATYRQTLLSYRFVAPVLSMGIPQALLYFLPSDGERKRGVLIECVSVLLLIGALFFLFFATVGNHLLSASFDNPQLVETLRWFSSYALLILPVAALNSALIATGRHQSSALFSSLSQIGVAAAVIATVLLTKDVGLAIKVLILYSAVVCGFAFFMLFKISKGTESVVSRKRVGKMLSYSVPLGLGGAVAYLNINLDKVVVSAMKSPAEFSIYVNGAFEVPLVGMITGAASSVILPEMVANLKAGSKQDALFLWRRASVKCAIILFPITGILWISAPDLMVLLFGKKYESSADVFRIYILLIPVRIGFFGIIYQSCGKSGLLLRRSALALSLNLILTIPMTLWLGINGAALSTILVSWVVMVPYNCYECAKMLEIRIRELFKWNELGIIVASATVVAVLILGFNLYLKSVMGAAESASFYRLALTGIAALFLVPGLYLFFGVWKKEDFQRIWEKVTGSLLKR